MTDLLTSRLAAARSTLDHAIDAYARGEVRLDPPAHMYLLTKVAALAVVAGGIAVIPLATSRDRQSRDQQPSRQPPAANATDPSSSIENPALFAEPAREIEWSILTPDSNIIEAAATSIAAGPGGFVAVGMGFDPPLSEGQGRVWFSADAMEWVEVDRELFAPKGVYAVAATSSAYYLYAAPTPPTEGSPGQPAQLYRSANGVDWEPIGEPSDDSGRIVAAGDVLIRVGTVSGGMLISTDGQQWGPAELGRPANASEDVPHFDDRIVERDGTFYVRGWTADRTAEQIWSSIDGMRWTPNAAPATPGRLTSTPGALLSVGTPDANSCITIDPAKNPEGALAAQWACHLVPSIERFNSATGTWTVLDSAEALASPILPGVTAFGNQLVASFEGNDGLVSVWLSSDGNAWTSGPVEPADLNLRESGGSPQPVWVSGQNDTTIVIPISSQGVGSRGALVVGRIVDETDE